jgi:hypothetical protein
MGGSLSDLTKNELKEVNYVKYKSNSILYHIDYQ